MWVEGGDIHDELLDQLGAVLTVPEDLTLIPSAAELEALATAVAARWPDGASVPASEAAPVRRIQPATAHHLRRIGSSAWRAGSVAAALVVFSASAAAAAGGVPLPRPVRAVAYTVGLPVDSPALDDTNHHIKELKAAVKANDKPKAEATARRLRTDLTKVPSEEKQAAKQKVEAVLVQPAVVALVESPAPTTATTSAPATSTTTVTSPTSSTTVTTAAAEEKEKEKSHVTTTTTAPDPTTTTASDPTTTTTVTTAPEGGGTPSGDPGSGGDPGAGGAGTGTGGGDPGTTPTTTPDGGTTTTTAPAGGTGDDPATTTTTTSSTTTTTMPPPDPGVASTQP